MSLKLPILVTGGAGFIGSAFVLQWLAKQSLPVTVLDKLTYAGNLENLASVAHDNRYSFVLKILEQRAVVGEMGHIQRHRFGDKGFERGFAAQQPAGQFEHQHRMGPHHCQQRIDKRIRLDERAVQVDAERYFSRAGKRPLYGGLAQLFSSSIIASLAGLNPSRIP